MKWWLGAISLVSLGAITLAQNPPDLAQSTIVVYNRAASESAGLARFYAQARHIPADHLVGLDCPAEEEISRQEFDHAIAEPLREIFAQRKWWKLRNNAEGHPTIQSNSIHFVALMRGMPLKIRSTEHYEGDQPEQNQVGSQNNASVDSELSVLGLFSRQISGPTANPYFQSFRPIVEQLTSPLLLVARLDAPTVQIVRRMITDSVEVEKSGLWGRAYVDGANNNSGGLADGDKWLKTVVKDLRQVGIPTVYDLDSALLPSGFPMNDCVLYYGWYAGGVTGPFTDPGFAFAPGAVAVHIHSFSANTLRSPDANWVGPLLSKGAAASLGNVYEPYLELTAHLDILNDRLLHGFTLAESASMSQRVLSWMNVVVGDPLYRPYSSWLQLDTNRDNRPKSDWQMYHEFAVKNAGNSSPSYLSNARKVASRAANGAMIEDLGLMQRESGNTTAAVEYLLQARSVYTKPEDILRTVLEQADILIKTNEKKAALALVRKVARAAPDGPAKARLQKIAFELDPPPATPKPSP